MARSRFLRLLAVPALAALLAACGGTATPAPSGSSSSVAAPSPGSSPAQAAAPAAKPLRSVTLRLPFLIAGYDAPFVLAKDKGWYAQNGLNVTIGEGKGSAVTAETVGNGADTYGFADSATVAQTISKGNPVKVLAALTQSTPMALYSRKPINSVKSLQGQKILTFSGDADFQILPAVLATAGMTVKDIRPQFVSVQSLPAVFAKTPGIIAVGFQISNGLNIKQLVPGVFVTPYSKFGINPLSQGLIASLAEIKNHPADVKGFVAASLKGWQYTMASAANENEALNDTMKAFPTANKTLLKDSLDIAIGMVHSPATKGKPLGWMARSDWQSTMNLLHKYGGVTTVKPLSDYYTNQFVPTQG